MRRVLCSVLLAGGMLVAAPSAAFARNDGVEHYHRHHHERCWGHRWHHGFHHYDRWDCDGW